MRILYVSYDGLLEPLGQSQVLEYLRLLSADHEIDLITFEKGEDWSDVARRSAVADVVHRARIRWTPLRYHRAPAIPATAYDLARGWAAASAIVRRRRIELVHVRSYIPAILALALKRRFAVPFVFDMRGFWPDEKVDAGTWRRGSLVHRSAKALERRALVEADVVVSLTRAGVETMRGFEYLRGAGTWFEVIPTCTNLERFTPPAPADGGGRAGLRLGYVGNIGGWYLFDPVLTAFEAIRATDPAARLTVINQGQHRLLRRHVAARGLSDAIVECRALGFHDVPDAMRAMDAAAFFIKPVWSKLASAPTKLGEFLACGVPCLVNDGVGDMGTIVREEGVGVVVDGMDAPAVASAARRLAALARDPGVRDRCVRTARRYFSLEAGASAYDRIYRELGLLKAASSRAPERHRRSYESVGCPELP